MDAEGIMTQPAYLDLGRAGLRERSEQARELLDMPCRVCPRGCKVNRAEDDRRGFCRAGARAIVSSFGPHFGEEAPLVGSGGSGTIFFASCNLACVFCQNWQISQAREGEEASSEQLARMMLWLQQRGCHNINLVSPTIYGPQILDALLHAIEGGLRLPLVYNSGGYDSLPMLRLLDGVVDVYMPDIKYSDDRMAARYSLVKGYYGAAKEALREMHRQVGDLVVEDGVAVRGLIIRHLVLPEGIAGTGEVMRFIAEELSPDSYVNVMAQYRPDHKAARYPALTRRITGEEYREAVLTAHRHGLRRLA
jgi:putative pyruvate formate lyase activating enzyme